MKSGMSNPRHLPALGSLSVRQVVQDVGRRVLLAGKRSRDEYLGNHIPTDSSWSSDPATVYQDGGNKERAQGISHWKQELLLNKRCPRGVSRRIVPLLLRGDLRIARFEDTMSLKNANGLVGVRSKEPSAQADISEPQTQSAFDDC